MIRTIRKSVITSIALASLLSMAGHTALAETLNPEGVNPHANAPRKRITLEQRQASAAARKQKKAEIESRKKVKKTNVGIRPSDTGAPSMSPETMNK